MVYSDIIPLCTLGFAQDGFVKLSICSLMSTSSTFHVLVAASSNDSKRLASGNDLVAVRCYYMVNAGCLGPLVASKEPS